MAQKKCYSYVRFSSTIQREGDSLRRQRQLSENYAKEHDLILDTTLNMQDLGLSAFKGDHIAKGALGEFLQLVEQGRIEKGSILLVESLDRLSRGKITDALQQFLNLIKNEITIITLQDHQKYTPDSIDDDMGQLMISITIMSRAYEESKAKQLRLQSSWEEKRKNAEHKKLTSRSPHWLKISKDKTHFKLIPDRVNILKRIFELYLSGMGVEKVSRVLNNDNIPTWGRGKLWGKSYIWKILRARTVLGEFQPMKFNDNRKSIPVGDPIKGYYPQAIAEKLFYAVQDSLEQRRGKFGRVGVYSNLFPHVAKCGYCGDSMTYLNKGKPEQGWQYLVCNTARCGGDCQYHTIKYKEFEDSFLNSCRQLSIKDIVADSDDETIQKITSLKEGIIVSQHKIEESEKQIDDWLNLYSSMSKSMKETIMQKMEDEKEIVNTMRTNLSKQNKLLNELRQRNESSERELSNIKENLSLLNSYEGKELADLRMKIRAQIQTIVDRIDVYPIGQLTDISTIQKHLECVSEDEKQRIKKYFTEEQENASRLHRCFIIFFKNGGVISIRPDMKTGNLVKSLETDEHQEIIGGIQYDKDKEEKKLIKYMTEHS